MSDSLTTPTRSAAPATLRVRDAISLILGIVVGSAIFKLSPLIFSQSGSPEVALGVWVVGGLISFCGGLCFAEMASADPRSGGEYNYLSQAYGSWAGFAFAWAQLSVIQTTNIAGMSYVFGDHAARLVGGDASFALGAAIAAVISLTALNLVGLRSGRFVQNSLSIIKLIGLALLIGVGLLVSPPDSAPASTGASDSAASSVNLGIALIMVLYAYGGWNDAAFVVAELDQPRRNIPRAMFAGIALVTAIYLLVNLAYWRALGWPGVTHSNEPAADVMERLVGGSGERFMALVVMLSALGAVNGVIFSVARVYVRLAEDHPFVARLVYGGKPPAAAIDGAVPHAPASGALHVSLIVQCVCTVGLILLVGTSVGQQKLNSFMSSLRLPSVQFSKFHDGFETTFAASALLFWPLFVVTGIAYLLLRRRRPAGTAYHAPLFPLPALLFIAASLFGCQAAYSFGGDLLPLIAVPLLAGVPVYGLLRVLNRRAVAQER